MTKLRIIGLALLLAVPAVAQVIRTDDGSGGTGGGGSGATPTFNPNQFSVGNGSTNIPSGALFTNLIEYAGHDLRTGNYNGDGKGLTNLFVLTNALSANIGTPAMADKAIKFSTNGVLNFTAIVPDPNAPAGAIQYWRAGITNTAGSVQTYTIPAAWISAQGGTWFNTNICTITIEYWPGFLTNAQFQCIR